MDTFLQNRDPKCTLQRLKCENGEARAAGSNTPTVKLAMFGTDFYFKKHSLFI
jgi:hypothetical protein